MNTDVVLRKITEECSLSNTKWFLYNLYYHPENKATLAELESMTIPKILDYQESLEAMSLLKEAAQQDAEHEARLNTPKR